MKKTFGLPLIVLLSITVYSVFAQAPTLVSTVKQIAFFPEHLMYPMQRLSAAMLANNGTLAAQVANTDLPRPNHINSLEEYVTYSWPARAVAANVWQNPALTVQEAMPVALGKKEVSKLSAQQKRDFYSTDYMALLIEAPFLAQPEKLAKTLDYNRTLLSRMPDKKLSINHWAQSMAAVTVLGVLGTAPDAAFILQNAKKPFPAVTKPWTDLITARNLLSLGAYDEVQALADYRLQPPDDATLPVNLPEVWHDIQTYMNSIGHPLNIPASKIAGPFTSRVMPMPMQEMLAQYNPYNLFHVDPSVKVTQDWVQLRNTLQNKTEQARKDSTSHNAWAALHTHIARRLRAQATTYTVPERLAIPEMKHLPSLSYALYENAALYNTDEPSAKQALKARAMEEWTDLNRQVKRKEQAWQELGEKYHWHGKKYLAQRKQLEQALEELAEKRAAAAVRLSYITAQVKNNTPADKISYIAYGYTTGNAVNEDMLYTTHLHETANGQVQEGELSFFRAPAQSNEDARLKQALLDRARTELRTEQQNLRALKNRVVSSGTLVQPTQPALAQAQNRLQSAMNKFIYIKNSIEAGAPYTVISAAAYGPQAKALENQVWPLPKIPFRFEIGGAYLPLEAPVSSRKEGQGKQALLTQAYQQLQEVQRTIRAYQNDIAALRQDTRSIGHKKREFQITQYETQLAPLESQVQQAQGKLESLQAQIAAGQPIAQAVREQSPVQAPNKRPFRIQKSVQARY